MTPVRGAVPVLLAARNFTTPFPVPLAPDEIVNQDALLDAVQEQPAAVETLMEPLLPAEVPVTGPNVI